MSLTSYRAAPPRGKSLRAFRSTLNRLPEEFRAFKRPGSDLLSRVLRHSTIGAESFHGRVRNGIGCSPFASATRSFKRAEDLNVGEYGRPRAVVDRCTEQHDIKPIELLVPLS